MGSVLTEVLYGLLRYGLISVSTWLITKGIATQTQVDQMLTGLAGLLIAVGWLIYRKFVDQRIVKAALNAEPGTTIPELNQSMKDDQQMGVR